MISFLITTKSGSYLEETVADINKHATGDFEIVWEWDDGRGQRAMLNKLAKQAKGDILAKVDAHCSFGHGFDEILLQDFEENSIIAPQMFPLYPETWTMNQHNRMSNFVFDPDLVMQHVPPAEGKVTETMCMQGSFFMLTKKNWFDWNVCDESLGSWGQQGVELGLKAWYNNGKCLITKNTFYGHYFKLKEEDFLYKRDQKAIDKTYNLFIEKYLNNRLSWLVRKFDYPVGWTEEKLQALCKNQSTS